MPPLGLHVHPDATRAPARPSHRLRDGASLDAVAPLLAGIVNLHVLAVFVHYRETSLVTRLVTSKVLVIGARNGFARNDLVTTS